MSRVTCQLFDINGCHFDVCVVGKYRGKSSVSFTQRRKQTEKPIDMPVIVALEGALLCTSLGEEHRGPWGPLRTNKGETD